MIPKWLEDEAACADTTVTELSVFGHPLIFSGNGVLFAWAHPRGPADLETKVMLRGGMADPAAVFYADPYLDERDGRDAYATIA
jgi:hypothetical protein